MSTIAATNSLFEIDAELDSLLDEIEEQTAQGGEPPGNSSPASSNSARPTVRRWTGSGAFLRQMEGASSSAAARLPGSATGPAPQPARWSEPRTWSSTT
jgi:hypothetical protein